MNIERKPLRIRLTIDDGLAPYLQALVASPVGIFGDERATIIFALREFLIKMMEPDNGFREPIIQGLPADLRELWRSNGKRTLSK